MDKRITKITLGVAGGVLIALGAFGLIADAEEVTSDVATPTIKSIRQEIQNIREERRDDIKTLATTTKTQVDSLRAELKAKIAEIKKNSKTKIDLKKEAIKAEVKTRITNRTGEITKHLTTLVETMEKHIANIETRMVTLESKGINTVEAKTHLSEAKGDLSNAKIAITNINTVAEEALKSDIPKTAFEMVRTEIKKVEETLKSARTHIGEAVTSLKNNVNTTSASSTNQ